MEISLKRHSRLPILTPDPTSPWESQNVFNPSVVFHQGLFHLHYRAQGGDWVSRIGYAVSHDGVHFNRLREPVLVPEFPEESRGVEDPRVTPIEGGFVMTYTAYGPPRSGSHVDGGSVTPMLARSENLVAWERIGALVRGEDNKDHVLLPRRVKGRYVLLHRRRPQIWIAYSDDLARWGEGNMHAILGPRPNNGWDSVCVGANGVPIETDHGWILLYHGYDERRVYRWGVALLDGDNPAQVIRRPRAPIFWPEEMWEVRGDVPNVVFSNGHAVVDGILYVYYGGADHVIGLATCSLAELVGFVLHA